MSEQLRDALALLPEYLGQHMSLSVTALAIGISISLPLAILATRWRPLQYPLLTVTGVLQTVPSLALLALMVPLLGRIGFVPALLALVLYSMLPVVRNTITGIEEIQPSLIEAARGIGMTDTQQLVRVELPLAAPVILAGVRTATVWVVGITTLSTPVGATSLGNYIFSGLQTQNYSAVMVGVVAAAGLAIALDMVIRLLEVSARRRSLWMGVVGALLLVAAVSAAFLPNLFTGRGRGEVVNIGSKTFTEQYILAQAIGIRLEERGIEARNLESLGSSVLFEALAAGNVDVYVDYSGTIWTNYMDRRDIPGAQTVLDTTEAWLAGVHGIRSLGSLGFENAYAFAMRRDMAEEYGIETIGDLAPYDQNWTVGGDYSFFGRPEWKAAKSAYGLRFAGKRQFDSSLMYPAVREGQVEVIVAFSSDGRIPAFDLATLDDPKEALPPYDAMLLLSPRAGSRPEVVDALGIFEGAVPMRVMREANRMVDVEGRSVGEAARWLLTEVKRLNGEGSD